MSMGDILKDSNDDRPRCTFCRYVLGDVSDRYGNRIENPADDGVTICPGCVRPIKFVKRENVYVPMTDAEIDELPLMLCAEMSSMAYHITNLKNRGRLRWPTPADPEDDPKYNVVCECGDVQNMKSLSEERQHRLPKAGDFSICTNCHAVRLFIGDGVKYKMMTDEDVVNMPALKLQRISEILSEMGEGEKYDS